MSYKDVDTLRDFIGENGKIVPARLTGTRAIVYVEVPGAELPGVFSLRTLEDSLALLDRFKEGGRVAIVGAGLSGIPTLSLSALAAVAAIVAGTLATQRLLNAAPRAAAVPAE